MTLEEFISIVESTSIELYNSEWGELETAFNQWKEQQEKEKCDLLANLTKGKLK